MISVDYNQDWDYELEAYLKAMSEIHNRKIDEKNKEKQFRCNIERSK